MKLSVKAVAVTAAIFWGVAILVVGFANMVWPPYGGAFLDVVSSIYPGYEPGSGTMGIIVGSLYGVVDAGIGGAIFAWLYNLFAG